MTADTQMGTDSADKEYLYKDLTEKVIGGLFRTHNKLGYGYREKEYQRAFAEELKMLGLTFQRELFCNLLYGSEKISRFFIDFLVEGKLVVELKVAEQFYKKHFDQMMTYLKTNKLQLGLLAIFTKDKVLIKRIINQKSA